MDDVTGSHSAIDYSLLKFGKPKHRKRPKPDRTAVYRAVDDRDHGYCRVCLTYTTGESLLAPNGRHHHHLVYRSRGGTDTTENVLTLCRVCHQQVHDGLMKLSGNANDRDEWGRGCLQRMKPSESGWVVVGWV